MVTLSSETSSRSPCSTTLTMNRTPTRKLSPHQPLLRSMLFSLSIPLPISDSRPILPAPSFRQLALPRPTSRTDNALFCPPHQASNSTWPQAHRSPAGSQSINPIITVISSAEEEGVRKSRGSRQEALMLTQEVFPFNTARKGNDSVRRLSSTVVSSPCCRKSSSTPKYTAFAHRSKNPAT